MGKLDVYLRSIERFGAAGAVLTSGQAVLLRFPSGDRSATQVTPHDQLVMLVREIAPPSALDQIDKSRPARFEIESNGIRYLIDVTPKPNAWQVAIEAAGAGAPAPVAAPPAAAPPPAPLRTQPRAASQPIAPAEPSMELERGQYDTTTSAVTAGPTSGSGLLDTLTSQARAARASDIYLGAGAPAFMRANGELASVGDRSALDGETLAREIGVVAPAEARAAWQANRISTFTYGDGAGRVRVTLSRDHRGPCAAMRLLPAEAPPLDRLGLPAEVSEWLDDHGLIVIAGPSGAGKTTTLGALVRALGERKRTVVTIEDPIELIHVNPWISQRAVGEHVGSLASGVKTAMREGADAIVLGAVDSAEGAMALVDALSGGHLVITTVNAPAGRGGAGIKRVLDHLPVDQRELARALCSDSLLGTIAPVVGRGGSRTFETAGRGGAS